MRWWTWMTLAMLACSGDGGTGGDDDDDDDDDDDGNVGTDVQTTPDGDIVIDCDAVPEHDNVEEMTCDGTWSALLQVSAAARLCNTADDCRAQRLNCEYWVQAECWLLFNYCIDKEDDVDIGKYMEHGATNGCVGDDGDRCSGCGSALPLLCVNHYCEWDYSGL